GDELTTRQLALSIQVALAVDGGDPSLERVGLALGERCLRAVDVGPRPLQLRHLVDHRGLARLEVGAGLVHARLEELRVEASDHLASAHLRIEVSQQILDLTGDLTAHLDCDDGVHRPGGRDHSTQRASLHHGRTVLRDAAASLGLKVSPDADADHDTDDEHPTCTTYNHD